MRDQPMRDDGQTVQIHPGGAVVLRELEQRAGELGTLVDRFEAVILRFRMSQPTLPD
jgi:hypothetical protein